MKRGLRQVGLTTLLLALSACGGARHRKVNGPPPEYELPVEPGAADAGTAGNVDTGTAAGNRGPAGGTPGTDGGVIPSAGGVR